MHGGLLCCTHRTLLHGPVCGALLVVLVVISAGRTHTETHELRRMRARRTRERSPWRTLPKVLPTWPPSRTAEPDAVRTDAHVITLRGPDGWQLDHPAMCLRLRTVL